MGELFKQYMRSLPNERTGEALSNRIAGAIGEFEAARRRTKIAVFSFAAVLSAFGFAAAAFATASAVAQSGFLEYLSLLSSDVGALSSFWKELALSLAASIPVAEVMVALCAAGILLWSLTSLVKTARPRMPLAHAY